MTSSAAIEQDPHFIEVGRANETRRIAVRARAGGSPGLFWLRDQCRHSRMPRELLELPARFNSKIFGGKWLAG